jgi:hypothetical protein
MSNENLRNITNSFLDARLLSLAHWRQASEIAPRDHGGPYVITQEGFDPEDITMTPDEFVLGRSGKWMSIAYFYKMSVPERRSEFVFGTAGEIMKMMSDLPPKASVIRPSKPGQESAPIASDDMAVALKAARAGKSSTAK